LFLKYKIDNFLNIDISFIVNIRKNTHKLYSRLHLLKYGYYNIKIIHDTYNKKTNLANHKKRDIDDTSTTKRQINGEKF